METLIKINNQSAGRDKLARLLQYLSRFLWYRLQKHSKNVDRIKNLEFQLSTFRKLLRLGRFVDVLYSVSPLFCYPDSTVRTTVILSKISNAMFLLADHILWLGRADICNVDTDKWTRICVKYWLYSVTMNLVRDFYEILKIIRAQSSYILPKSGVKNINEVFKCCGKALLCVQSNRSVMVDTVKNFCDFFIPFAALGHVSLSPGTVGLLGTISSIAGLLVLTEPNIKLTPS